jgi:hypothetical protein
MRAVAVFEDCSFFIIDFGMRLNLLFSCNSPLTMTLNANDRMAATRISRVATKNMQLKDIAPHKNNGCQSRTSKGIAMLVLGTWLG